jgi:monovalent cation:H+ antiporter, CPA1 family
MELSLIPVLAVFVLFAVSGAAYFAARRTGIPHSVLLVAIGVALIPISKLPGFAFLHDFILTPELLFYIFLPTLIFESAYNINIRRLTADAIPVALLSIASLLISALVIAMGLYFLLPFVGMPIPFSIAFLFGSLISATDPVAVLALFKEYGAPRRLALLFEGESLFNDGTGLALFLVALEFAIKNDFSIGTIGEGVLSFSIMLVGGAILGLVFGGIFSKAVGYARSSESVAITLTLVLAHVTFLVSEYISSHAHIGGFSIHLSSIIATTMAAMVMGNYGRSKLPHGAEEFVEKFWGQIAFLANSIIFILIGLLAVSLPLSSPQLLIPIGVVVLIVAVARALSIYPVVGVWNRFTDARGSIPRAWQHLLAWGSLRGALAVTMALLVPTTLTIEGWTNDESVFNVVLAFTTGCIFVTLFFKATTIGPLMRRLKVGHLSALETAEYDEGRSLAYAEVLKRLDQFVEKGYITRETHAMLKERYEERLKESHEECATIAKDPALAEAALRIWMLGIEKEALRDLYVYGEISEHMYKRVLAKLAVRTETTEQGKRSDELHVDIRGDMFEQIAVWMRGFRHVNPEEKAEDEYMYYRALTILANKAEKELRRIRDEQAKGLFSENVVNRIAEVYVSFKVHSGKKMQEIAEKYPEVIAKLAARLARSGVLKVEEGVLDRLIEGEMITPKVHAVLREEMEHETT